MVNLAGVLMRNAERRPGAPAIRFEGRTMTWGELGSRACALAAALLDAGIERGAIVAILLRNCPQFIETVFAVNLAGAVFMPLNFRLAPEEWSYILGHSQARLLITESEYAPAISGLRGGLGDLRDVWTIEGEYEARVDSGRGRSFPVADAGLDGLQRLMYTSGTTARPKGAMITHGNVLFKNLAHIVEFGLTQKDVGLVAGPLYHVGGLDLPASTLLYLGASIVILPRFDPVALLDAVQDEKVTATWLAPGMLNQVLRVPGIAGYDTSSLRLLCAGGEKMPVPLIENVLKAFPNARFADGFGMTETVSGDTFLDRGHTISKAGSVGKPLLHVEIGLVDDLDRPVKTGELGELVLRGPKVTAGYWRDPEGTAQAMRGGWFHTGDIGRLDEEGFLYIEDRKKDMIVSGGENIATPEVERVLYMHPAVVEAAVVGIPHERWGEVPKAFVVVAADASVTPADLVAFCRRHLARFKVPAEVELLEALPRNPSGKVLKRRLRGLR